MLEVDIEYPKTLHKTHKDLAFLPERRKINGIEKLITTLNDKEKYIVQISALKQALNHGLKFKKVHRVIEFRQTDWMRPYIDMNTKLRTEAKNESEKDFFKLMNNAVFGKAMENLRKHRDIKLVVTNARRRKLVSEPNYHACKQFSENLIAIEMRRSHIMMDKQLYLGQAILDISKTLMYEFYYDYLKVKYAEKVKLCYTDTDSFIIYVETEDFYKDIANDVDKWFDTLKYDKNDKRPLPLGKNKKVIGKFKDELNGKIMSEFIALSAKVYAFTIDGFNDDDDYDKNGFINKKAKGTKKCVIKKTITSDDYKKALFNNEKIRRNQQRFKSDHHVVNTTNINKTALNNCEDKRLQTFNRVTTYQYGTSAFKVYEPEMQIVLKNKQSKNRLNLLELLMNRPNPLKPVMNRPKPLKLCDTRKMSELKNISIAMYY